jgi:hypothetical protein
MKSPLKNNFYLKSGVPGDWCSDKPKNNKGTDFLLRKHNTELH